MARAPRPREVGASCRDIRLRTELHTPGDGHAEPLTEQSSLGVWLAHPVGGKLLRERLDAHPGTVRLDDVDPMALATADQIPLTKFNGPLLGLDADAISALVAAAAAENSATA
ncbi:hypothetical protein [Streptomyces sp. NPDC019224]|uniref:hypothetical protein n=1 Tax=Streptomyces sp. NPDC019224 TaxID=3154484 RepID=UPI0033E6A15B